MADNTNAGANAGPPAGFTITGSGMPASGENAISVPTNVEVADVGPLAELGTFDIRNGNVEQAFSLLVRPTIPVAYHWMPIRNLPPGEALKYASLFVRQALTRMEGSTVENITVAQKRKLALIMGISRAVMTAFYHIAEADLIPGERAVPWLEWVAPTIVNGEQTQAARVRVRVGVHTEIAASLASNMGLTALERSVVGAIHGCAVGLLPNQGYSLVMTGHHYLSDKKSQSYKVFKVIEDAVWKSPTIAEWWTTDLELLQDAMWHKAGHPVNIAIKMRLAYSKRVKAMIMETSYGAAASRLPAQEAVLRTANSYKTLVGTVRPMITQFHGELNDDALHTALNHIAFYDPDNMPPPNARPTNAPDFIVDRATALVHLHNVIERNKDIVAYVYGFYCALDDETKSRATEAIDNTLRTSYSLKKLRGQSTAAYVEGYQAYADYQAAKAATRRDGVFVAPKFTMA